MRLKVLVPYREEITYQQMKEIIEEEATKLGWARPIDFQTEIVVDASTYGREEFGKEGVTRLAISARVHKPYHDGRYGVDPHDS